MYHAWTFKNNTYRTDYKTVVYNYMSICVFKMERKNNNFKDILNMILIYKLLRNNFFYFRITLNCHIGIVIL